MNVKSIVNGKVLYKGKFHTDLVVIFEAVIEEVLSVNAYDQYKMTHPSIEEIDGKGDYILPGFIDVHTHGYKGIDTMDGDVDQLEKMSELITENGVTAFLPTTMTMPMEAIAKALDTVIELKAKDSSKGAIVLGAHLEGPYINEGFKGAQPSEFIRLPQVSFIEKYKEIIKVMTIAPEVDGAIEMIEAYKDRINFSLGHTGASYEQALKAYETGAKGTTHLFNAMTGLHHRKPGVVGAALTCDCYSEVIADNFHVNPGLFKLLVKAKGLEKLLLITDCMRAGGLEEGMYTLGGQEVTMKKGQCTLANGTIAGSVLKLHEGLKNVTEAVEEELSDVVALVTENQAKYLGVEDRMGTLDLGKEANIVIMNATYDIEMTLVRGNKVYENRI